MGRMWNVDKEEWQQNAMQYAVKYRRTWEAKNNYPQDTNRWNTNNKKKIEGDDRRETEWLTIMQFGNTGILETWKPQTNSI